MALCPTGRLPDDEGAMSDYFRELFVIEVSELSAGVYRVALSGEMDIATSPELVSRLAGVRGTGPYWVLVDLSRLSFIDSSGIKALVSSAKTVEANGGALVIVAPPPQLEKVFDIVQLSSVIPVSASLDEALGLVEQRGRQSVQESPAIEG
jgi:anti-anti-sigma factor